MNYFKPVIVARSGKYGQFAVKTSRLCRFRSIGIGTTCERSSRSYLRLCATDSPRSALTRQLCACFVSLELGLVLVLPSALTIEPAVAMGELPRAAPVASAATERKSATPCKSSQ